MSDISLEKAKTEQLNVVLSYILWWFLGFLGVHRFYTKQSLAWIYIVGFVLGVITTFIFIGYLILFALFILWVYDGIKLNSIVKKYNLEILEKYEQSL
ncbi:hypothetical protein CRU98_08590 [Arcobacter sp. CECT 8986]|uniref:NINE protein n=1 Tax=Arcobacter sp. CECT 8986 TaxID=2044507 RepID=UPI001009F53E|nr:TM2 domain-containing protein [Arcobacter sp. CECT 8986]RXJ98811.1 hypothetical protein CRU98_08590 [Arcobacter sp. CECT 8986]